ncbi:MAG: GNAT family N-acetyltransferase [Luteolibacter sp.]|uniref:GNAT family N-acetyltransferase n=1 Tax=Luteolibacter sp. TaxID=1962973 RepID=UPI003265D52D
MPISIHQLSRQDRCDEVFALYRKDSCTLGFMPRGAFEEGITKGTLLVATDGQDQILGYLLYRVAHAYASVAHLCVAPAARKGGVGKSLMDELKRLTTHLDGIKLKCRRDFEAHRQWPKWGFIAKGAAIGRGADNADLVIWHLDHNPDDLLSALPQRKTLVAIDANVFFDLFWPDRPTRKISGALLEPWIDDIVELGLTSEIYNDIDRCKDTELRDTSKAKAATYHPIRAAATRIDPVDAELRKFYPVTGSLTPQDISDIRHVAHAIVAEVRYFVTRDAKLLAKAPEILDKFDVQLLSPVEFVSRLDSIEREQEYQPQRLGASSIVTKRFEPQEIDRFIESFRHHPHEKISAFKNLIDSCLLDPKTTSVHIAHVSNADMAVSIAINRQSPHRTLIPLLRLNSLPLAKTVLRHLVMKAIVDAVESDARSIHIGEPHLTRDVTDALVEMGFGLSAGGWVKPVVKGFHELSSARQRLEDVNLTWEDSTSHTAIDQLVTMIWPGKPATEGVTSYLIPIQAQWAEHFFDTEAAAQRFPSFSGIDDELHLGVEAVYFTASNIAIKPPGHLLWYVSSGNERLGTKQVKATSRLREVVRGTPKELFSRFHRLGVYRWKDLTAAAKGNPNARLTALRFSHTENFTHPLDSDLLRTFNVPPPYPGPRPIPFATFREIYHHGFNTAP